MKEGINKFLKLIYTGPILERKGMRAIFKKKGKTRANYFKIWGKMYKI